MTAEEIVEFKTKEGFLSQEGRDVIKQNSIDVLREATKLDKNIYQIFKGLEINSYDSEIRIKLRNVFS